MTEITATLSEDANPSIIRQVLENMKGVLKVSIRSERKDSIKDSSISEEWIKELHSLVNNLDRSAIDIDDERTRYILRGSELLNELEEERR